MKTALAVLDHFPEFHSNEAMRKALIGADLYLFHTVDVAKYEIVMEVRRRLPNAQEAIRVGSSGKREFDIIEWAKKGHPRDDFPKPDPQKQFVSDDDISVTVDTDTALGDPLANEKVNAAAAEAEYRKVTRELGHEIDPKTTETQFLSPTRAWQVLQRRGEVPAWPNYLFAWTASNPEKYNDMYGVEMLKQWGYEKGYVTRNLNDPLGSTVPIRQVQSAPDAPPPAGKLAYIANNYRQIYNVHKGNFLSECKYLVRMIDAWEAVSGPDSLPDGWQEARRKALAIYTNGADGAGASAFRSEVGGIIDSVVHRSHEFHLDRVTTAMTNAMQRLKPAPGQKPTLELLAQHDPTLLTEVDALIVAYSNVPETLHAELMKQFQSRIQAGENSADTVQVYRAGVLKHVMEVVQDQSGFTRTQIDAFADIRSRISRNLSEHLEGTDLDRFVEGVARGQMEAEELRLIDGRIRRVKRQLAPEDVMRDIRYIEAVSTLFRWDAATYARRVREYFEEGPSTALNMLRRMYDIFDSSRARDFHFAYDDADGATRRVSVRRSGESLAVHLFKGALKGYDIWGKAQNGRELYKNLHAIYGVGGKSDEEIGQAQAQAFGAALDFYDLLKNEAMFELRGTGVLSEIALGTPGAAWEGDADARRKLMAVGMKDLLLIWQPQLAPAFVLFDLASWAYHEYNLYGLKSDVITAMVENGVWVIVEKDGANEILKPFDEEARKQVEAGQMPALRLQSIRLVPSGTPIPKKRLASEGVTVTLIESGRRVVPRPLIKEVAYKSGYISRNPIAQTSVDAINSLKTTRFFAPGGMLSNDAEDWDWDALVDLGILLSRREDQTSPVPRNVASFAPDLGARVSLSAWLASLPEKQARLLGYLVADFWVKQQLILENDVLKDLEKEAGRQLIDKIKREQLLAGNFDFQEEIKEIDEAVKEIDKKLWPRVARSTDPFDGSGYDPEKDTPILSAFQRATADSRDLLQQLEEGLKVPGLTTITLLLPPTAEVGIAMDTTQVTREQAENSAAAALSSLRQLYYKLYDGYEEVHKRLDSGVQLVHESRLTNLEPFHVSFSPSIYSLLGMLSEGMTPAAEDLNTAAKWLGRYKDQRIRVAKDIEARSKEHAIEQGVLDWIASFLSNPDVGGSPSHPLWPELVRLRYQIQKLNHLKSNPSELSMIEIRHSVGAMTLKPGEPVDVPSSIKFDERVQYIDNDKNGLILQMENQYRLLLDKLGNLFEMELTMNPEHRKPFIGQTVEVTANVKIGALDPAQKTRPDGFPDYVTAFEWTIRDEKQQLVKGPERTAEAKWEGYFPHTNLHFVEVHALDKGNNILSSESMSALLQPLLFVGTVKLEEGDYEGQEIAVFVNGSTRGTTARMGDFSTEVTDYDEFDWAKAESSATARIEEKTYRSSVSSIEAAPDTGFLRAKDPLRFKLPFNVDIKVEVKDRAQLPVSGAEAVIQVGNRPIPPGLETTAKLERGEMVGAEVLFPPLQMEERIPPEPFDPGPDASNRGMKLEIELPMLDVDHLQASGVFVPEPSIVPAPALADGKVASNVHSESEVQNAGFSFTNGVPIDLRQEARVDLTGFVFDRQKKAYRPESQPASKVVTDKVLDFGPVEVVPGGARVRLEVSLADWNGTPLPPDAGSVLAAGKALTRQGGVFVGEHEFSSLDEELLIEGSFRMPDGHDVIEQDRLSGRDIGDWKQPRSPIRFRFRLGFYLPGGMTVRGSARAEVAENAEMPAQAAVSDPAHGLNAQVTLPGLFSLSLAQPVLVKARLDLEALAQAGGLDYRAKANGLVPDVAGTPLDLGEIILLPEDSADFTAVQTLTGECKFPEALEAARQIQQAHPAHPWFSSFEWFELQRAAEAATKAKVHLERAEQEEASNMEGALAFLDQALAEAPPDCVADPIRTWRQALVKRITFVDLTENISRASSPQVCDFQSAERYLREIDQLSPLESWMSDWLNSEGVKVEQLRRKELEARTYAGEAQQMAAAAQTPEDWKAVDQKVGAALAAAPACLRDKLGLEGLASAAQRQVMNQVVSSIILLIDTSGSMSGGNKIDQAKRAAKAAVRKASKQTEMAVLAFDGGCNAGSVKVVHDFSTDANSLIASIDKLTPGGGTPMYIAVGVAIGRLKKLGQGRQRTVVLMSDGGDTCRDQQAQAAAVVRTSNIPVNAIGFDVGNNAQAQQDLANLASLSGGRTYSASTSDPREIIRAFDLALLPALLKDFEGGLGVGDSAAAVRREFSEAKAALQSQDLTGALRAYQRAHGLSPDSAAVNYNLSLLYEAEDQLNPSMDHARRYLQLAPQATDRADVENRIHNLEQELKNNPRASYDPGACRDLYLWAQQERKRAKKPPQRRQAILEIIIAAQRGQCPEARRLAEAYRSKY